MTADYDVGLYLGYHTAANGVPFKDFPSLNNLPRVEEWKKGYREGYKKGRKVYMYEAGYEDGYVDGEDGIYNPLDPSIEEKSYEEWEFEEYKRGYEAGHKEGTLNAQYKAKYETKNS